MDSEDNPDCRPPMNIERIQAEYDAMQRDARIARLTTHARELSTVIGCARIGLTAAAKALPVLLYHVPDSLPEYAELHALVERVTSACEDCDRIMQALSKRVEAQP